MFCWFKFILFMMFLFPIITTFRLALTLPYIFKNEIIIWMKWLFTLPYFFSNILLQILFFPLFPLIWWFGLCLFAYKDKDNPTKISLRLPKNKRRSSIGAFDSRLCMLSHIQLHGSLKSMSPPLHRLKGEGGMYDRAYTCVPDFDLFPSFLTIKMKKE